jgi:cytoskeletal protein CcmA (bactofilin family)
MGTQATVIARGVKVEGEFASQGDVTIDGEVHGTLAATGRLSVGTDAKIMADVKAGEAIIAGSVQGNIFVQGKLELKATARIIGDLTAESFTVEQGAAISGKVSVGVKGAADPKANASVRRPA